MGDLTIIYTQCEIWYLVLSMIQVTLFVVLTAGRRWRCPQVRRCGTRATTAIGWDSPCCCTLQCTTTSWPPCSPSVSGWVAQRAQAAFMTQSFY